MLMKGLSKFLLSFLTLGLMLSCARAPQRIELHRLYAVPRRIPLGQSIPLGVAEGLDAEKVRKSIVQVIDSEGSQGSGFFVAPNKIATAIHVVTGLILIPYA